MDEATNRRVSLLEPALQTRILVFVSGVTVVR
jgi:hypothetical protein